MVYNGMKKTIFVTTVAAFSAFIAFGAESKSPVASVSFERNEIRLYEHPLAYEVVRDGVVVVAKTEVGLKIDGKCVAKDAKCLGVRPVISGNGEIATPVYKKSGVNLRGQESVADFADFGIRLVARNDGVAYRFELKKSGTVTDEKADLTIPKNARCWFNRTPRKMLGCEETVPQFADASALKTDEGWAYYLPFVYSCDGTTVAVAESDVSDYPAWNFGDVRQIVEGVRLSSLFAKYPKATELSEGGARKRKIAVKGEEDFIAKASAPRLLPWRVFALADTPSKLCETDIVYALARPADGDFSWVRPGKVAWDWWNDFDNKGGAGCSTGGYVRFIDFAAKNGVEYVIFDEGWSANLNIWKFSPKVDVPYLIDYANKKGVGIILWMAWAQVYGDEERVAEHFAKLGAKGFKVDFMDRGDAEVAEFMEKFAAACAKHHMIVDYHGAYRPVGLHRTYPNILNYEGIHGLEQMKWSRKNKDMPYNDVAAFFLRMTAGPMDYTPGAMDNYKIGDYRGNGRNPGSVGTRAHQMALMALYEAPLQMLADSPTKYEKNMECFSFMAKTPVVWDATIGLGGCPESYAAVARKAKDGAWYAAAISNRDARDITISTDFLGDGEWKAEIFRDADDADKEPTHYVHEFKRVKAGEKLTFRVSPGGGFVVRFDRSPCASAKLLPFVSLVKNVYAPTDDNVSQTAALALPGVRLANLDGAYIGCRFRGIHIANKGGKGKGCNVRRTPDGKGLRIEFQIHDDKYIKCVLVDLTDGEGGVWARKVGTSYRAASRSVKVGCHFGDVTRNDGYEVYGLFAAPSEPNPLPIIPQPMEWKPSAGECDLAAAKVEAKVDASSALGEEGYTMKIAPGAITVVAGGDTGAVWARQTLAQLKASGAKAKCGTIRDIPKYRVRAFMMDVGRMYHSMDFLYDLAKTMSYYKMNVLHIHLNDNAGGRDPNKYAAFRLESETYPELTAKDGHYTKKEFREFMLYCKSIGVTVIPEIDVPAHSLAFTRVRPDFASKKYGADHLDLDKSDEILAWLKPLFAEYMTGKEPTFAGPYVHVGTDEYNKKEAEKFRAFTDAMLKMVIGFGYKPCAWGALSHASGKTPVIASRDITMDIWNNRYYHPEAALKAGYTVVSIPDKIVYLVPFGGYYNDYFNCRKIYETWDPTVQWRYKIPEKYFSQLAGGKFALWNDLCGKKKDGTPYTEADNWDRIHPALQTFSQKMWCGGEGNPPWERFSAIADSLNEPAGVKSTHVRKLAVKFSFGGERGEN